METVVKRFGNSLGISIPASLRESRNIGIGTHVDIVEHDANLIITVRGHSKKVPTLQEMLAQCDLSAEREHDLVSFDAAPAVGMESI